MVGAFKLSVANAWVAGQSCERPVSFQRWRWRWINSFATVHLLVYEYVYGLFVYFSLGFLIIFCLVGGFYYCF